MTTRQRPDRTDLLGDDLESTRRAQQRSAERLAEALTATAGELARRTEPVPVTAAHPDVVDLLGALAQLRIMSQRLQHDLMLGAQIADDRWTELAVVFEAAARECRGQIGPVILPGDVADIAD